MATSVSLGPPGCIKKLHQKPDDHQSAVVARGICDDHQDGCGDKISKL